MVERIPPSTPNANETTNHTTLTIIEMMAHNLAFFAAALAPAISPTAAFLFTCAAKITEINPCGRQHIRNESTAATMAITILLGTVFGAPAGGGGVQFCDMS